MVTVELVAHDPVWIARFAAHAADIAGALGTKASEIHHIGSTSIPGIVAKPVIDILVSTVDFDDRDAFVEALEGIGYRHWPDNDDRRKHYFTLEDGDRRLVNVHVRRRGEFSGQAALLFRDYLRAHPEAAAEYAAVKVRLAASEWDTVDDYADAKGDCVWSLLRRADAWAWSVAWQPPPGDL